MTNCLGLSVFGGQMIGCKIGCSHSLVPRVTPLTSFIPLDPKEGLVGMANGQNCLFSAIVCWQMVGRKTSTRTDDQNSPYFFFSKNEPMPTRFVGPPPPIIGRPGSGRYPRLLHHPAPPYPTSAPIFVFELNTELFPHLFRAIPTFFWRKFPLFCHSRLMLCC